MSVRQTSNGRLSAERQGKGKPQRMDGWTAKKEKIPRTVLNKMDRPFCFQAHVHYYMHMHRTKYCTK